MIDRIKLVEGLEAKRRRCIDSCLTEGNMYARLDMLSIADELEKIINDIENGVYDI